VAPRRSLRAHHLGPEECQLQGEGLPERVWSRGHLAVVEAHPEWVWVEMPGPGAGPPAASTGPAVTVDELVQQGIEDKNAGRLDDAEMKLRAAVLEEPNNEDAHWALAWTLAQAKKKAEAITEFNKVLELTTDANSNIRTSSEEWLAASGSVRCLPDAAPLRGPSWYLSGSWITTCY